jgi:curved DNA-binding protein CbpA
MTDLYAVLGVPRDADRAAIRHAYRDLAHTAHPDGGGTPEAFARIKLAHDILTDDVRRKRYDENGEISELTVDNRRAQLMETLSSGLDLAILKLARGGKPPKYADMAKLTGDALRDRRREWNDQRLEFEKTANWSRELLGRFSAASGDNIMESIVAGRIAGCETQIETLTTRIKLIDEALELLSGMAFRADAEPAQVQAWLSAVDTI